MSLFGTMRTGVSGMNAQANRIGAVAQNVANVGTTGYKRAGVEFETLLGRGATAAYATGGVISTTRRAISEQGALTPTSSVADLAIRGGGFFLVANGAGAPVLTRAGAFTANERGELVNTAGYRLMGHDLSANPNPATAGYGGLAPILVNPTALVARPTTRGALVANLPSESAAIAAPDLPSTNSPTARFSAKSSLTTYDSLGRQVMLDVYFAKTGSGAWQASVFDATRAAASGGFPYSAGPLTTTSLVFDSTGKLTAPADGAMSIAVPGGSTMTFSLAGTTQLAAAFSVRSLTTDGSAPSAVESLDIAEDGTLSAIYQNGARVALWRIPLADVVSPDNLTPLDGDAFAESASSGRVVVGDAGSGARGRVISRALESSTVDIASELTTMIEAQRGYAANSKVFQAGSELLDVLMSLKA